MVNIGFRAAPRMVYQNSARTHARPAQTPQLPSAQRSMKIFVKCESFKFYENSRIRVEMRKTSASSPTLLQACC